MVRTLSSNIVGAGSISAQGAKIPHASRPKNKKKNKNIKQKQYGKKKIQLKTFKMVHIWKKNEMMKGEMIEAS